MPIIDISFDAEEWMLEPITGEEDAHILTLASGPVAVELVSSQRAGVGESAFQEAPSERGVAPWATRLARLGNW